MGTCIVTVATAPWDGDVAARRGPYIFVLILTTCHTSLHGPTLLLAFKAAFKIKLMATLPKSTLTAVSLSAVWVLHPRSWTWASVHPLFSPCHPHVRAAAGQLLAFCLHMNPFSSVLQHQSVYSTQISRGLLWPKQSPGLLYLPHTPFPFATLYTNPCLSSPTCY